MTVALSRLRAAGFQPKGDIILAVTAGEEFGMAGARYLATEGSLRGSGYLVVGEPTNLEVCTAQKGGTRFTVTIHGIPAHSSTPQIGVSAIAFAARLIPILEENPFDFIPHPLCGNSTVTVTNLHSEGAYNVVPAACRFSVGVRCVPGQRVDGMQTRLEDTIAALRDRTGMNVRFEVSLEQAATGIETPADHDLVRAAVDAISDATGRKPRIVGFTGGTEAVVYCRALPLPFIIVGPGNLQVAHQTDEWVAIEQLEQAVRIYEGIAHRLLG